MGLIFLSPTMAATFSNTSGLIVVAVVIFVCILWWCSFGVDFLGTLFFLLLLAVVLFVAAVVKFYIVGLRLPASIVFVVCVCERVLLRHFPFDSCLV